MKLDDNVTAQQMMAGKFALFQCQQEMLEEMRMQRQVQPDLKVKGVEMPKYHGGLDESLELFFFHAQKYCQSQNIDMYNERYLNYAVSLITVNLRGAAAAWYQEFMQQGVTIESVQHLKDIMSREFVPVDIKKRLRKKLVDLKQKNCKSLEEYITKFRKIISEVRDMSSADRVMGFTRGLVLKTRQEVVYRRCQTTTEAIAVALEFERSHSMREPYKPLYRGPVQSMHARQPESDDMEICNAKLSKEECFRRNLCFYCQKPRHRISKCYKRNQRQRPARVNHAAMRHEDDDEEKEFDIMNVKIINVTISDNSSELIRKDAYIGGKQVKVLIDSGDDHNIIRPHLGQKLYRRRTVRAMRFDGSSTTKKSTNIFKYKIKMEGQVYKDVILTEWELLEQQDIILGKPWLVQYNPRIDWRTHTIELPTPLAPVESEEFEERVKQGNYTEVYSTSIKKNETERVPTPIHQVLDEFPQVIPDQLPDVLPPERDIEHVILLEQDAKPFTGAPFRLSKGARSSG